jgi:signal transduction histidine kinase
MIQKLRRKFILTATLSLLAVMAVLVGALNITNYIQTENNIDAMLSLLAENGGKLPEFGDPMWEPFSDPAKDSASAETGGVSDDTGNVPSAAGTAESGAPQPQDDGTDNPSKHNPKDNMQQISGVLITPETKYQTRYFVVDISETGSVASANLKNIAAVTEEDAASYAAEALKDGNGQGWIGIYKFLVTTAQTGKKIIFLDCRVEIDGRAKLLLTSLIIALCSLISVFLLITIFSGKAVRPYAENYEKQKQFITDASHEIKTPLAIISANAEVLEMTSGGSEWLTSIKKQTSRLDKLVNQMVMLARMDEEHPSITFAEFQISDAVYDAAAPFDTVAQCAGKHFELAVEPKLKFCGDEGAIRQLTSILCDNAVKYSDSKGTIRVTLRSKGKNIILEVFNTCHNIDRETLPRLFDRFYRADSSRSRETGGYGIGLSIAKAITEAHKGKITVRSDDGKSVVFTVVL